MEEITNSGADGQEPIKKFITEIQKTSSCHKCLHLLRDAVLTKCGHQFCRSCVVKSCPICKGPLSKRAVVESTKMKNVFSSLFALVSDLSNESGIKTDNLFGNLNAVQTNRSQEPKSQARSRAKSQSKLQSLSKKELSSVTGTPEAKAKVSQWLVNVESSTIADIEDDLAPINVNNNTEPNENQGKSYLLSRNSKSPTPTPPTTRTTFDVIKRGRSLKRTNVRKSSDQASDVVIEEDQDDPYNFKPLPKTAVANPRRSNPKKRISNPRSSSTSVPKRDAVDVPINSISQPVHSTKTKEVATDLSVVTLESTNSHGSQTTEPLELPDLPSRSVGATTPSTLTKKKSTEKDSKQHSHGSKTTELLELPDLPSRSVGATTPSTLTKNEKSTEKDSDSVEPSSFNHLVRNPEAETGEDVSDTSSVTSHQMDTTTTSHQMDTTTTSHQMDTTTTSHQMDTATVNRLTFSVQSETQDLLELNPLKDKNYTQNQFHEVTNVNKKVSNINNRVRKVTFHRIGRLTAKTQRRAQIVFKRLGKLEVNNNLVKQLLITDITNTNGTQTLRKDTCTVSTQVGPDEFMASNTVFESFPLNSLDFLEPTNPSMLPSNKKKEEVEVPLIIQEEKRPPVSKRNRETNSSGESAPESNNKRIRINENNPPVTPNKTQVPESDSESSEDIFLATPKSQKKTPRIVPEPSKPKVFVCSGLPNSQIKLVEQLARLHNSTMLRSYESSVTHIIVRIDQDKSAERTLKFLYGVAARKWIVSIDWVKQCLEDKHFVDEEPFEVLDMDGENGPFRARLSKELLFSHFEFCCIEPFTDVTVQQLRQLLELCGAETVDAPAKLSKERSFSLLVMQGDSAADQHKADVYNERLQVVSVSREWVLDCIASYQLYPLRSQIIGKVDLVALRKLGFSHILE